MPSKLYFPQLINHLIEQAAVKVASRASIGINNLYEPEITDALVTELPSMVNQVARYNKINVRFGGCYIHQKPKAHYKTTAGSQTSREIGDLLVVCRQERDGIESYNATIFQMKMHDGGKQNHLISSSDEKEQLELYKMWPHFECIKNGTRTSFDLYPKTPHQGAQYGLVSRDYPHDPIKIFHSMPATEMKLSSGLTFGDFIQDFIIFQKGRAITPRAQKDNDEWSRLVWYLIDISWMSVFRLKRLNHLNQQRIGGDFFNIYDLITNQKGQSSEDISYEIENKEIVGKGKQGEQEGISLLLIEVNGDFFLQCPRYKNLYSMMD